MDCWEGLEWMMDGLDTAGGYVSGTSEEWGAGARLLTVGLAQ